MKKETKKSTGVLKILYIVLVVVLVAAGGYFYWRYQKVQKDYTKLKNTPLSELAKQAQSTEEQQLIKEVGERYNTPKDEVPTIAQVSDIEKLKGQQFFANAKNGDKVLAYQKAKIAILYRPDEKKIINVGPYNEVPVKVSVQLVGAGTDVDATEKALGEKFADTVAVAGKSEPKNLIAALTIIDVSGKNGELAKKIADELKGTVGEIPIGEDKPQTDIAVFIPAP